MVKRSRRNLDKTVDVYFTITGLSHCSDFCFCQCKTANAVFLRHPTVVRVAGGSRSCVAVSARHASGPSPVKRFGPSRGCAVLRVRAPLRCPRLAPGRTQAREVWVLVVVQTVRHTPPPAPRRRVVPGGPRRRRLFIGRLPSPAVYRSTLNTGSARPSPLRRPSSFRSAHPSAPELSVRPFPSGISQSFPLCHLHPEFPSTHRRTSIPHYRVCTLVVCGTGLRTSVFSPPLRPLTLPNILTPTW